MFAFLGDGYFWLGIVAGVALGVWLMRSSREYKAFQAAEMQKQIERDRALIYDDDMIFKQRTGADDDLL